MRPEQFEKLIAVSRSPDGRGSRHINSESEDDEHSLREKIMKLQEQLDKHKEKLERMMKRKNSVPAKKHTKKKHSSVSKDGGSGGKMKNSTNNKFDTSKSNKLTKPLKGLNQIQGSNNATAGAGSTGGGKRMKQVSKRHT